MSAKSVIVSVQEARCTANALPVARRFAELEEATLHVLHVAERAIAEGELPARVGATEDALRGAALHTSEGDVGASIVSLARAQRAAAVVMCTRTPSDPERQRLGDAARTVLAELACPVVLVRPEPDIAGWKLEEVLIPHDGSPATSAAIGPAADLAARAGAHLLALHVASPGKTPASERGSLRIPRYVDQPQHEWPAWAGEFVERLGSMWRFDLSRVRFFLGHGETGGEIVRVANEENADLLLLAWHGTLGAEHAQVFKHLLRHAPCPMMVLRVPRAPS